jgi:quercetin dioxygenase-like cupin family protein
MRTTLIALAIALTCAAAGQAQAQHIDMVTGDSQVKWGPAPPVLPKGAQIAVLSGDPFKPGLYVLRLKLPANYAIPAHHHPTMENVTVISGDFRAGMGDKLDREKTMSFGPGGFAALPANMNHFAWAASETVVQVHGEGPFAITYANPADDPSKQ